MEEAGDARDGCDVHGHAEEVDREVLRERAWCVPRAGVERADDREGEACEHEHRWDEDEPGRFAGCAESAAAGAERESEMGREREGENEGDGDTECERAGGVLAGGDGEPARGDGDPDECYEQDSCGRGHVGHAIRAL